MAAVPAFPMPQSLVVEEVSPNFARFIAAPFQRGFGLTIGTALRRVLLSSLEGSAISAVRIEGISHEFTTMPNVVEDITEIILNLKGVKFNLHNADQPKIFEIKRNVAGPVTAGDIITDGTVEVLNPEHVICNLDKDIPFRAEIEISKGRGWRPAEKNKLPTHPYGTIAVDCLFSPVVHVNPIVSATRVGEETEMDSLTLEIETDGRISPKDALEKAALILKDHLRPFLGNQPDVKEPAGTLSDKELQLYKVLIQDVETLELSVRAMNCLNNANIKLIGELCMKTESRMLKFRNFGKKSLEEIKEKLAENNLALGMTFSEELSSAITTEADRAKAVKKEEA